MRDFHLKIVTPEGMVYDGPAEELTVRTLSGDMGILAGHINCAAPLGTGEATVAAQGKKRSAACNGGMVSVIGGEAALISNTFLWTDETGKEPE